MELLDKVSRVGDACVVISMCEWHDMNLACAVVMHMYWPCTGKVLGVVEGCEGVFLVQRGVHVVGKHCSLIVKNFIQILAH